MDAFVLLLASLGSFPLGLSQSVLHHIGLFVWFVSQPEFCSVSLSRVIAMFENCLTLHYPKSIYSLNMCIKIETS